MPGPGAHMMYTLADGSALLRLTRGRFGPHHCLVYAINAFLGPDLGSFAEWLTSVSGVGKRFGSGLMDLVHDPFYYTVLLGFPLCLFYSWVSEKVLRSGYLDSLSGVPLSRKQCLLLISAGSLSHFFLDHLFEENGNSKTYRWVLSTGFWKGTAPIEPDSVIIIGFLCTSLLWCASQIYLTGNIYNYTIGFYNWFLERHRPNRAGFIYINRTNKEKTLISKSNQSLILIFVIAILYCLWCASQIYLRNPPRPAIGEEADLGVIIFLSIYFFLPHGLCILSMNQKDHVDISDNLPL